MCGLNITLNASEKSLKEQIIDFINKIIEDLKVIDTQENKVEILTEYKRCLNLSKSMIIVADRKKEIEQERKRQEELVQKRLEEETKATAEALQNFIPKQEDEIIAPKVIKEVKEEQRYSMTFTVNGTMEQLKNLKEYLKKEGLYNE